jgi:hypothetical protein
MGTPDQTRRFKVTVPVTNPTAKSAKRALTTSFGSICYGSLIIALIQTLRQIVQSSAEQARQEGGLFALFCLYCVDCILSIIESIIQYFNKVIQHSNDLSMHSLKWQFTEKTFALPEKILGDSLRVEELTQS